MFKVNHTEVLIGLSGNTVQTVGRRREIDLLPAGGILLSVHSPVVRASAVDRPAVLLAEFVVATVSVLQASVLPNFLASVSRKDSGRRVLAPLIESAAVQFPRSTRHLGTART